MRTSSQCDIFTSLPKIPSLLVNSQFTTRTHPMVHSPLPMGSLISLLVFVSLYRLFSPWHNALFPRKPPTPMSSSGVGSAEERRATPSHSKCACTRASFVESLRMSKDTPLPRQSRSYSLSSISYRYLASSSFSLILPIFLLRSALPSQPYFHPAQHHSLEFLSTYLAASLLSSSSSFATTKKMNRPKMEFIQTGQDPYYQQSTIPRNTQPSLRVQTSNYPTPQAPSPSPSDPPYPRYPIPIPPDKQDRALELYIEFQSAELAEGLEQRQNEQRPAHNYLSVPGPSAPQSTASRTSSKRHRAPSVSTTGDGQTEFSSVMSFDGDESPSSAKARQSELRTFDGKIVKQRVRKRLSPKSKAKAALIRYLGSCWVCRKRAVSCPLEHYDIASLEKLHQANLQMRQRRPRSMHQSRSSKSIPRRHARSISTEQATANPQTSDLFSFIGQNPNLLQSSVPYGTQLDIQSPGGLDPLSGISPNSAPFYQTATEDPIGHSLYSQYQDGAMLAIGVLREGYFKCRYLGLCNERFNDPESLQLHFERSHFAYTRIDPACRVVCKQCQYIEDNMNEISCERCRRTGQFEMWIYGRFIRSPSYWSEGGDGRDAWGYTPTSASYAASHDGLNLDGRNDESGGFNGSLNGSPNTGNYHFQNFGIGPDSNATDYPYLPQNQHQNSPSNNRFQGNNYDYSYRITSHTKFPRVIRPEIFPKTKTLGILLFLLVLSSISITLTLALSFSTSPLSDLQRLVRLPSIASMIVNVKAHMPAVAFMSLVGSFGVCSSVKHVKGFVILGGGRSFVSFLEWGCEME